MNVAQWIGVGVSVMVLLGGMLGWFVRLERRQGTYLTRAEHEQICKDRNDQTEKAITALRADMESRHSENRILLNNIQTTMTTLLLQMLQNKPG